MRHDEERSDNQVVERPKRKAAGADVNRLEMRFDGKQYPDLTVKQFLQARKDAAHYNLDNFLRSV